MEALKGTDSLVFEVEDLRCAVEAASVVEIVRAASITAVPGQPDFIAGAIDVRGKLLPVLDMRVRLGRSGRAVALSDHFIILDARAPNGRFRTIVLWVDAVEGVASFDIQDLVEAEGLIVGERSLAGIARTARGLVMIHDPQAFLTEAEKDALAAAGLGQ